MPKVAVIILNFKVKDLAKRCIESVKKSTFKNLEIIVVDNSPEEGLKDLLDSDIGYIPNGNTGYTGGNNLGIKKALKNSADFVFILNPDTEIEKDTIKILIEGMENRKADIAGPKIYFGDKKTIWYAGGVLDKNNVLGTHRGVDEIDKGQFDEIIDTDFVSGCAILIKKEVMEKVGLFDERFFLYLEDLDLCYRAKMSGFKIVYIPEAKVYHHNAKSTGLGSPLQDYFITRNRMLYALKFLPFRTRFALFREALRNLANPVRRLALWDFLTGKFGRGSFKV